jgi:hypothetical protein
MKKLSVVLISVCLLLGTAMAQAKKSAAPDTSGATETNGLVYKQVNLSLVQQTLDFPGAGVAYDTANGARLRGEWLFWDKVVGSVSYQQIQFPDRRLNGVAQNTKTDMNDGQVTVGYRHALAEGFDLVPYVAYSSKDAKRSTGLKSSQVETMLGLQLKKRLSEQLQGAFALARGDRQTTEYNFKLLYKVNQNWGLTGEYGRQVWASNGKSNVLSIGVSYLF